MTNPLKKSDRFGKCVTNEGVKRGVALWHERMQIRIISASPSPVGEKVSRHEDDEDRSPRVGVALAVRSGHRKVLDVEKEL